jgi:hypothetical protein
MKRTLILALIIAFLIGCDQRKSINYESAKSDSISVIEKAKYDSIRIAQEARNDSLIKVAEQNRIANLKDLIKIIKVYTSPPNSAGGVDVHTIWTNKSNKTVKYISFQWVPYNAVGDIVSCEIRGEIQKGGRVTGPIKPGQTYGYNYSWECEWYNNTITRAKLMEIEIEYMDNTAVKIEYPDIQYVYKVQE